MFDLSVSTLARAAWSKRQLLEVMVDFWSNHLNVTNPSDSVWSTRHDYDRTVIRKHALGKYSDMLLASATHPAMMTYLNNAESTKDQPNENYGRELLELHSVGVDAGYSEEEMYNSALIMTGFGIDWDTYLFNVLPGMALHGQREGHGLVIQQHERERLRPGSQVRAVPGAPPRDRQTHRREALRAVRERQASRAAGHARLPRPI